MEAPARLTPRQAMAYIGGSESILRTLRESRKVKYYRIGHRTVSYDRASLDAYLKARVVEGITSSQGRDA